MGSSKSFDFGGVKAGTGGKAESDYSSAKFPEETRLGGKKPEGAGELQYGHGPGKFAKRVDADDNGYGKQRTHKGK